MAEFLHMGGYAWYVWSSYGVVTGLLVYHYVSPLCKRRALLRELSAEAAARRDNGGDDDGGDDDGNTKTAARA